MDTQTTIQQGTKKAGMAKMYHLLQFLNALGYDTEKISVYDAIDIIDSIQKSEKVANLKLVNGITNPF